MQPLSDRTAGFTDSVIRRMTRISNKYGAVNLSQGFPDFDPPKEILDRLAEVAHEDYHQYSITWGAQNFREALAAKQTHYMGRAIDPDSEIVVTCGSTEAMMTAMMTVTNPGDKVVIFSPFYENYGADTILSGAEPIYVPLTPPAFNFDPEVLEDAFRQHPKALILCIHQTPAERCSLVRNWKPSLHWQKDMMSMSSPMKFMNISSMRRTPTHILQLCPACGSGRSPAHRCPKHILLQVGGWAMSSHPRPSSNAQKRYTTF